MKRAQLSRLRPGRRLVAVLALVLCLADLTAALPSPAVAAAEPSNPVLDWSLIAENAIVIGRPPASSEVLGAIVQVAVYDTVIALHGGAQPYVVHPKVTRPASTAAAVATAAHHLLVARVPAQAPAVDSAYAGYLAGIPDGTARSNGIDLGARVAAAILALRANDGYDNQVPYAQSPPGPGVFEPVAPTPPVDTKLAQVRPLTYHSPDRFRPGGPPQLTSRAYARDLNQVKALGRADSTVRTPDQTEAALFWSENTFQQWGRNLRTLAGTRHLGVRDSARLLTMAHVAAADALIGCFEAKYHYRFWRPVHAIARADTDDNPATSPDPTWTSLLVVNHPEYPSAHACFTTALTRAVAAFFGTAQVPLTLDSTATGTSHRYRNLDEVVREVRLARVAAGLHYRHSMLDGEQLGRRVARHVIRHHFRSRSG
jgi:hypothetical protein